jgi:regulator of protease activity HflC (stomatin/prohibitin superfamily)
MDIKLIVKELKMPLLIMGSILAFILIAYMILFFVIKGVKHGAIILTIATILTVAIIIIGTFLFLKRGLLIIREGQVVVVERLGQHYGVFNAGVHIIIPIIDKIRKLQVGEGKYEEFIDVREREFDPPAQEVITKDNARVNIDTVWWYKIVDPAKTVYEIEDVISSLSELIKTVLLDTAGDMTVDELVSGREKLNQNLQQEAGKECSRWGIEISKLGLQSIDPLGEVKVAMDKKASAEKKKLADIIEAEGKKRAKELEAEGDKKSIELRAEAERKRIEQEAIAQAEALTKIRAAVGSDENLITIKYLEALGSMSKGDANKIFLPFESSKFLGAVGAFLEGTEKKPPPLP